VSLSAQVPQTTAPGGEHHRSEVAVEGRPRRQKEKNLQHSSRITLSSLVIAALILATVPSVSLAKATRVEDALWAGGVIWDTILTPASFKNPPAHSVDLLFDFSMSGLTGQRGVADSYPGQRDYNGGRWWVQMVVFTPEGIAAFDGDGDGEVDFELTSADELLGHLELGHLEVFETATYFECPLKKAK
jgi:hypothetical protein